MVGLLSSGDESVYLVQHLYEQHRKYLGLELIAGSAGLIRRIHKAEVHRPGLSLTGYLKGFVSARILVIGKQEIEFIPELESKVRTQRLQAILTPSTPAVIVARGFAPPKELISLCEKNRIPLFRASSSSLSEGPAPRSLEGSRDC